MKITNYYTQTEFAKKMNVNRITVWRWVKEGKVKTKEIAGKKRIVFEEETEI